MPTENKKEATNITRKQAIKKMSSYAAFAALGTMVMLNPAKVQALSPPPNPDDGFPGFRRSRKNRNNK